MCTTPRVLLSLLAIVSLALTSCAGEPDATTAGPRLVLAMKIGDVSTFEDRWVPGRAKAARELDLSFRVDGRMVSRPVFVGDRLKEGDLVAQIDPTDYKVEVQNAEGNLDEGKAALTASQADLDRVLNIQREDPGAVSRTAVDRAREERDRARATIKSLEAALADAKNRLERAELRAPFDATVVARYVEPYEDVRAKQTIVRLVDSSKIEFEVNVPENEIGSVSSVVNIRVKFDALPDLEVPAEIKEIGTEASLTTRTYPVTLVMDQPKGYEILPGMAGRATGEVTGELSGGVLVPLSATFTEESGSEAALQGRVDASPPPGERPTFIWIVDEQALTVARRQVVLDAVTARGARLTDGVESGEWVVTAGVHSLVEGQRVRISQQRTE